MVCCSLFLVGMNCIKNHHHNSISLLFQVTILVTIMKEFVNKSVPSTAPQARSRVPVSAVMIRMEFSVFQEMVGLSSL